MKAIGKKFQVRGSHGIEKTMFILGEQNDAYQIHMVTRSPYGILESDEELSKELFASCLRTGFINEIKTQSRSKTLTYA